MFQHLGRRVLQASIGLLAAAVTFGAASEFVINPPLNQAVAVAYSPVVNKLLFSQPFCGKENRQVVAVSDTGVATLFATLPPRVSTPIHADCWEDKIAVSPGLGGFTKGMVYVTQGQKVIQVPPTGGVGTVFVTIPDLTDTHTGIAFDSVGTFGFQMILGNQNGKLYSVSSTGVVTPLADTTGLANPAEVGVENGNVAPLSWGVYGGWYIVTSEDRHRLFALSPLGTPSQHPVVSIVYNIPDPEFVHFIPQIVENWGASGGVFFDIIFDLQHTKVMKFPASDFPSYLRGQALVTEEEPGLIEIVYAVTTAGTAPAIVNFTSGLGQQEGSTFVTQPQAGCTLTMGAYKNHFSTKVVPLTIGGTYYSAGQLIDILNEQPKGNGAVSLAHQLITAKLNTYWGASTPASVATAIFSADQLIATVTTNVLPVPNKLPPFGTAFLNPGVTGTLTTVLDNYNNGLTGPGHCPD